MVHLHRRPFSTTGCTASRPITGLGSVDARQNGVVIGPSSTTTLRAPPVMRELYENGVWAIFSTLTHGFCSSNPVCSLPRETCEDVLDRLSAAVGRAKTLRGEGNHDNDRTGRSHAGTRPSGIAAAQYAEYDAHRVGDRLQVVAEAGYAAAERFAATRWPRPVWAWWPTR